MRGKWLLGGAVAFLIAAATGALVAWKHQQPVHANIPPPRTPAVFPGTEVIAGGQIRAQKLIAVPPPVDGAIENFQADVGDSVFEGQLLARIKSARLDAAHEQALRDVEQATARAAGLENSVLSARLEASRARAEASQVRGDLERLEKAYLRQEMLMKEGATPRLVFEKTQKEYEKLKADSKSLDDLAAAAEDRLAALSKESDRVKTALTEKTESLEEAQAELAAGEVHSPVDGIVVARRGQPGSDVSRAILDLFQIATDLTALEIAVDVPPSALPRIRAGQQAIVQVAEVAGEPLAGVVREVKGGQVIVEFKSPTPSIKPGLTAQVKIKLS